MTSPIARLNEYGQSPWYDNIRRSLLESGELTRMITDDGIRGVTSNPTIFEKAISAGTEYDDTIQALARQGLGSEDIGWELLATDVGTAADLLRPTYDACGGADGFVSIEVSPELAADTAGTVDQARQLHERLDRPTVMVKIPATPEGIPAIETMIGEGRNINVTLIFSLVRYGEVIEAYFSGLERLAAAGGDLSAVRSSQPISSLPRPYRASAWITSSYSLPAEIAFSKIVGFDVTPRIPSSVIIRVSSPPSSRERRMLSYQGLWP